MLYGIFVKPHIQFYWIIVNYIWCIMFLWVLCRDNFISCFVFAGKNVKKLLSNLSNTVMIAELIKVRAADCSMFMSFYCILWKLSFNTIHLLSVSKLNIYKAFNKIIIFTYIYIRERWLAFITDRYVGTFRRRTSSASCIFCPWNIFQVVWQFAQFSAASRLLNMSTAFSTLPFLELVSSLSLWSINAFSKCHTSQNAIFFRLWLKGAWIISKVCRILQVPTTYSSRSSKTSDWIWLCRRYSCLILHMSFLHYLLNS